jgi:uncharacterized protein YndB with AHSA1/START domain
VKYMLLIYGDEQALDESEREQCYRESAQLADQINSDGHYLAAAPLHPTSTAASVRVREGKRLVTDGPFAETREQLGGYFLIDVRDRNEAIAIAARIPMARQGTVEVRPVIEIAGLPPSSNSATAEPAAPGRDLAIGRIIEAPRAVVFKAWTDPTHVAQWWGPHGFTNPVCKLDVWPGGAIRVDMRGPDGRVYPMTGVYQTIVEPERLVFTSAALDEKGNPLFEVLNTVTFADQGGKTTQMLRARVVKSTAGATPYLEGMEEGWTQSLERLETLLGRS